MSSSQAVPLCDVFELHMRTAHRACVAVEAPELLDTSPSLLVETADSASLAQLHPGRLVRTAGKLAIRWLKYLALIV